MKPYSKIKGKRRYHLNEAQWFKTTIKGRRISHKFFELLEDGRLYVRAGYTWDGPSGPTIHTHAFIMGSLAHDVLYQAIRLKLLPLSYRDEADDTLRRVNIEYGMCEFRAWYTWKTVTIFGGKYCKPGSEK